jgi:hypothetical protein
MKTVYEAKPININNLPASVQAGWDGFFAILARGHRRRLEMERRRKGDSI